MRAVSRATIASATVRETRTVGEFFKNGDKEEHKGYLHEEKKEDGEKKGRTRKRVQRVGVGITGWRGKLELGAGREKEISSSFRMSVAEF